MRTVDADAHVIETTETWEHMSPETLAFQPVPVSIPEGEIVEGRSRPQTEFWAIDGGLVPRERNIGENFPREAREMRDIERRLKHMDELSVDIQVLYPSLFLRPLTRNAEIDRALAAGYNRWLAAIWNQAPSRLRWIAVAPLQSLGDPARVRDELAFAKDNGACGLFMCGFSCDREITDPYFLPLYEIAGDLDLAVCFHAGVDCIPVHDFLVNSDGLSKFKFPVISAFHALLVHEIPQRFPQVRWAFVEAGSGWVPYVLSELARRFRRRGRKVLSDPLGDNNFYVACQVTDDIDYVVGVAGEDRLVVGTDYGHHDTSTEIEAMRLMRKQNKLSPAVIDKILGANATTLYGLD